MHNVPVIRKEDFSFRKISALARGYHKAIIKINDRKISRDRTFRIYDRAGKFLGYSDHDIVMPVSKSDAKRVSSLLMRLEDRRFYQHQGIDFHSIVRAIFRNVQAGHIVQGGSTLSMQLVRNTLIETNRTFLRKSVEMALARKLEKKFSKEEIVRLYCEQVFMGKHLRGLQSAAFFIYRKPIAKLSDEEICGLLGMLRSPQKFSPYRSQQTYRNRQKTICQTLKGKAPENLSEINPVHVSINACPHIARKARRNAISIIDAENAAIKRVGTSVDIAMQRNVDSLIGGISKATNSTISAVIVENKTGSVLSEASWNAGIRADFSPVIEGVIRPGSTYKTFALIAALEQGYNLDTKILSAPFYQEEAVQDGKNSSWRVRNHNGVYRGEISLRDAFVFSDNTVFARLTTMLDHERLFSVYRRFGLLGNAIPYPSIVLGALHGGINPIKLVNAYRAIANNGIISINDSPLIKYTEFDDGSLSWRAGNMLDKSQIVLEYEHVLPIQGALQAAACSYGLSHLKGKTGTTKQGEILVAIGKGVTSYVCYKGKRFYSKVAETLSGVNIKMYDFVEKSNFPPKT